MSKLHWTQRPENKAKLRRMHKKGKETIKAKQMSRAERIVRRATTRNNEPSRRSVYAKVIAQAVEADELKLVHDMITRAALDVVLGSK